MASGTITKMITMAEMLARMEPGLGSLSHGASKTITFSGTFSGILLGFHHSDPNSMFAYMVGSSGASCAYTPLISNAKFSVSTSGNTLTITNNNTSHNTGCYILCFTGENNYSYATS